MTRLIYALKVLSISAPLAVLWAAFYGGRDLPFWAVVPYTLTGVVLFVAAFAYSYFTAKRLFQLDI